MKDLDVVRLIKEFKGMKSGTTGVIVYEYDGTAFEVEFFDSDHNTIDVCTTPKEVLELVVSYKRGI